MPFAFTILHHKQPFANMSSHKEVTITGKEEPRKSKKPDTSDEEEDDPVTSGTTSDGDSDGTSAVDEDDDSGDDSGDDEEDSGDGEEGTLEDDALYQILKSFFTTSEGVGLADVVSGAQLYDNLKGIRSELHAMNKHIHGILQKLSFINHSKSSK